MASITLFSQIIGKLDRLKYTKLVNAKQTDKNQKGYNSWRHLLAMLFCQFAKSKSSRIARYPLNFPVKKLGTAKIK
jgi:hypothetical protein